MNYSDIVKYKLATTSSVSGAWARRVAVFGHSFMRQGWRDFDAWGSGSSTITGVVVEGLAKSAPSAALDYSAALGALRYNGGAWKAITRGGIQYIPGTSATYAGADGVWVSVARQTLPGTDSSFTCTRVNSTPIYTFGANNAMRWAAFRMRQGIDVENYAGSGGAVSDVLETATAVALGGRLYKVGVIDCLTNSVAHGISTALILTQFDALITQAKVFCENLIVLLDPPIRTAFSTTAQRNQLDLICRTVASTYVGDSRITILDPWASMIQADNAATTTKATYTALDGTHPGDAAAQLAGEDLYRVITDKISYSGFRFGSAAAKYDATTNPMGNLIPNSYPFGGATVMTGASSFLGTGVTAAFTKVSRTDGIDGEWQRATVTATTTAGTAATCNFGANVNAALTPAVPPIGSKLRMWQEVSVNGSLLMPDSRILVQTGAGTTSQTRSSVPVNTTQTLPITAYSGVLMSPEIPFEGSSDGIQMYMQAYCTASTPSSTVDFGRFFLGISSKFDELSFLNTLAP